MPPEKPPSVCLVDPTRDGGYEAEYSEQFGVEKKVDAETLPGALRELADWLEENDREKPELAH